MFPSEENGMQIKIFTILAFAVAAAAFAYGAATMFRRGTAKYFQLYVCAAGCFVLEELWVIVNSLLGNGHEDGLVTVRLIGLFGCLCFMLSANAAGFDKAVDDGSHKAIRGVSLAAPAVLAVIAALYIMHPVHAGRRLTASVGCLSVLPAIFASYFDMKHLLLPNDELGFLAATRGISLFSLLFYAVNFVYPFFDLTAGRVAMGVIDLAISVLLSVIVILCRKGAAAWQTLV